MFVQKKVMKKFIAALVLGIASLVAFSSCGNDDDEINFIFIVGWATDGESDQFQFLPDGSGGGLPYCLICVGYYYGDTYDPEKLFLLAPDKITMSVGGEGFGFADVSEKYGIENGRAIKINVDENPTTETRYGKLTVTASKGGKTESAEFILTQLPASQEE